MTPRYDVINDEAPRRGRPNGDENEDEDGGEDEDDEEREREMGERGEGESARRRDLELSKRRGKEILSDSAEDFVATTGRLIYESRGKGPSEEKVFSRLAKH